MELFLFLSVIWFLGLVLTCLHEAGHVLASGGILQNLQIGIAHKFAIQIKFKSIIFYPLLPVAGFSHITLNSRPTRLRLLYVTLAGSAVGLLIAILCVGFGLYVLPAEALTEITQTHRLGFLMRAVLHDTAGIKATVGTAFMASGIMYGVQQAGNLLPFTGFDGYQAVNILLDRRRHE